MDSFSWQYINCDQDNEMINISKDTAEIIFEYVNDK